MKYDYTVTVTERSEPGTTSTGEAIEMTFQSHDDLAEIVAKVTAKQSFDENEAKVFAVGLKMFASVMLTHRAEPLFAGLAPHFGAFMKTLKS